MKGISNTSRTLEYIRRQGWAADKVELFNPYAGQYGKRKDFLGLAVGENSIIAIQSCGQAFSEHHKKLIDGEFAAENVILWLTNGGRVLLIGWRKVLLKRGGKAKRWQPRIREYFYENKLIWKDQK